MRLSPQTTSLALVVSVLAVACGGDGGTSPTPDPVDPPPPVPTTITLSMSSFGIQGIGNTVQLSATVLDQYSNSMAGQQITWASSDTLVLVVDDTGLVTGRAEGTASVSAQSGSLDTSVEGAVVPEIAFLQIAPDVLYFDSVGESFTLRPRLLDPNGAEAANLSPDTWVSSDPAVAMVDGSGRVTSVGAGAAVVTASYGQVSGSAQIDVPSNQVSAVMGAQGGVLLSRDGTAMLDVPPDALLTNTTVTMEKVSDPSAEALAVPGSTFDFGPDGTTFLRPAILTVQYDPSSIPGGHPASSLGLYRSEAGGWAEMASVTVDTVNHVVRATVDHFSLFGLRAGRVNDLSGTWAIEETYISDTCYDEAGATFFSVIEVDQNQNSLSVETEGVTYTGTISGNAFNYSGTVTVDDVATQVVVTASIQFGNRTTKGTIRYSSQGANGACEVRSTFTGRKVPDGSVDGKVEIASLKIFVNDQEGPSIEIDGDAVEEVDIRVEAYDADGFAISDESIEIEVASSEPRAVGPFNVFPGEEGSISLGLTGSSRLTASVITQKGGAPIPVSSAPFDITILREVKELFPLTPVNLVQNMMLRIGETVPEAVAWFIGLEPEGGLFVPVDSMGAGIRDEGRRPGQPGTPKGLHADRCGRYEKNPKSRVCDFLVGTKLFEARWANWHHAIDHDMDFAYRVEGRNALGVVVSRTVGASVRLIPSKIYMYVNGSVGNAERERSGLLGLDNGIVGDIVTYQRSHLGPDYEDGIAYRFGDNYWDQEGDKSDDVFLSGTLPGRLEGDSARIGNGDYTCGSDPATTFILTFGEGDDRGYVTTVGVGYGDPACAGTVRLKPESWSSGTDNWGQVWEMLTIEIDGRAVMQGPPGTGWGPVDVLIEAKMALPRNDPWVASPGETLGDLLKSRGLAPKGGG